MIREGGYQPGAAPEARSFLSRALPPATVRKVILWVGLSLWLAISLFYLVDFLGLDVKELWKSEPFLNGAAILLLFLLRRVGVWDAARRRQAKKRQERIPASHFPINPT